MPATAIALRTSDFPAQIAAVVGGLGATLVPEPYCARHGLVPLELAPSLVDATKSWPSDELWLVGHRATRDLPRIAAVWDFLLAEFRA